jgi:hypothetical protein
VQTCLKPVFISRGSEGQGQKRTELGRPRPPLTFENPTCHLDRQHNDIHNTDALQHGLNRNPWAAGLSCQFYCGPSLSLGLRSAPPVALWSPLSRICSGIHHLPPLLAIIAPLAILHKHLALSAAPIPHFGRQGFTNLKTPSLLATSCSMYGFLMSPNFLPELSFKFLAPYAVLSDGLLSILIVMNLHLFPSFR